ncbi:hypothetical protein AADW59_00385 [Candidatus Hodgkinia cicadicola]
MYAKLNNIVVIQNNTSCETINNLILSTTNPQPYKTIKSYFALGRRIYTRAPFLLSLNKITASGVCALFEKGNTTTLTSYIVSSLLYKNENNPTIFKRATNLVRFSNSCQQIINKHKLNTINAKLNTHAIITNGAHTTKRVNRKRLQLTLILGKNHKATPFWSKSLTSATLSAALTTRPALTRVNIALWLNKANNSSLINTHKLLIYTRQHKLTKLATNNAQSAFISSNNYKPNQYKALKSVWNLTALHKNPTTNKELTVKFTFITLKYVSVRTC